MGALDADSLLQLVSLIQQRNSQLIATVGHQHLHALLELLTGAGAEFITTAHMQESTAIFFDTRNSKASFSSSTDVTEGQLRHTCHTYPAEQEARAEVVYAGRFKYNYKAPAA